MDRNQIDRGSMGFRLRSRLAKPGNPPSRIRDAWTGRTDPQSRLTNVAFRGAEYRRFARAVERELNPRGPLERIVTQHATRAAWELQHDLGSQSDISEEPGDGTSTAARTLKISITTLDLLQGRRAAETQIDEVEADLSSDHLDQYDEAVLASNEWPSLPNAFEADVIEDDLDQADADPSDQTPIWRGRLVFDFEVSPISPVIHGTWITVAHIINLIVDGATWADILRSHPELTEDDIRVCVAYAVAEDDSVL